MCRLQNVEEQGLEEGLCVNFLQLFFSPLDIYVHKIQVHKINVHKIACPFPHYRRAHACGRVAASDWGAGTFQKRPEASPLATAGFSKNTPTAGEEKLTFVWESMRTVYGNP